MRMVTVAGKAMRLKIDHRQQRNLWIVWRVTA